MTYDPRWREHVFTCAECGATHTTEVFGDVSQVTLEHTPRGHRLGRPKRCPVVMTKGVPMYEGSYPHGRQITSS